MTVKRCSPPFASLQRKFQPTIRTSIVFLLIAGVSVAQQASPPQSSADPQIDAPSAAQPPNPHPAEAVTIPAGSRLALVLTRPMDSKSKRQGDQVFAQITDPIISGDQVVVPAGTFVRGTIEKLTRDGTRAEMRMQSISLVFPNGYVANAGGPVTIESDQWTAWNNPSGKTQAGIFVSALGGAPIGMLIGRATDHSNYSTLGGMTISTPSHKGLFIGAGVGSVAGIAVTLALLARSHDFFVDGGSALEMKLPQPVILTRMQIDDANRQAGTRPPMVPQRRALPPQTMGQTTPVASGSPSIGPGSCSVGQQWCMGRCVSSIDFISDSSNCGRCGNSCSIGESCLGGSCHKFGP